MEPESDDAFLTQPPIELMKSKNQADVPYITGACTKEMILGVRSVTDFPKWTKDEEFQGLIPRHLNVTKDSELSLEICKRIRSFYFKNGIDINSYIDVSVR